MSTTPPKQLDEFAETFREYTFRCASDKKFKRAWPTCRTKAAAINS